MTRTEQPAQLGRCPTCDSPQPSMHPAISGGGEVTGLCPDPFHGKKSAAEPEPVDLLDLVRQYGGQRFMHGLDLGGAQPDEQGHEAAAKALFARIEAEVNRLRAERDDYAARLKATDASWAQVAAERDGARGDADYWKSVAVPAPADPLVLSLPQVPEGAVALVDRLGRQWRPAESGANWELRSPDASELLNWRTLGNLLGDFGPLTVVVREPRTWPKLDGAPHDAVAVQGARHLWRRDGGQRHHGHDRWYTDDSADAPRDISLVEVQWLDGPLTEVFDA